MNKINFNFEEHKDKKECVHCKTIQEAEQWCKFMYNNNLIWYSGESYLEDNHWDVCEENTCYNFNGGGYCSLTWYIERGYTIIEFSSLLNNKLVKL